jgi:hypothetical protein
MFAQAISSTSPTMIASTRSGPENWRRRVSIPLLPECNSILFLKELADLVLVCGLPS